jgi:hypothetical protein
VGEIDNPVEALLKDSTLRPGDMVMFPDGLRVFVGTPGSRHTMASFRPVSQDKTASKETRKLAAQLRPGENIAWSTAHLGNGGKLASSDVTTTGSIKRKRRQ